LLSNFLLKDVKTFFLLGVKYYFYQSDMLYDSKSSQGKNLLIYRNK